MKIKPYLSPCTKFNSNWIEDLGIRSETLHLIKEKVGPNLHHVELGPNFLNKTPKSQEIKSRLNKWDGLKLKSFFSAKETINEVNRESLYFGSKLFATHTSDRALISRIYKELKKLNTKTTTTTKKIPNQ